MVYRLVVVGEMHLLTFERVDPNIAPDCCYYYQRIPPMVGSIQHSNCIAELNRRSTEMVD